MSRWWVGIFFVVVLAACGEHNEYKPFGADKQDEDVPIGTFREVKAIVLKNHCLGCHDGFQEDDFYDYDNVMAKVGRIIPGNPGDSNIVKVLHSGKMPKNRPKIPDEMIALVERWIAAGAPP